MGGAGSNREAKYAPDDSSLTPACCFAHQCSGPVLSDKPAAPAGWQNECRASDISLVLKFYKSQSSLTGVVLGVVAGCRP